jgi:plastocyanin
MGDSGRETTERDESTAERDDFSSTAKRRNVLRALGGAGALAALGTASATDAADVTDAPDGAPTPEEVRERSRRQETVDPVWGFPALSEEASAPTSPQVEVELQIRPRDAPIPEFVFEPAGVYLESGQTVRFSYESPHHTVTAYHPEFGYRQRVPDEVPPFSSPALPQGGYWLYTFDRPGVYDIHCAPHEIFGHAMRIVVGSPSGPGNDPLPDLCAGQEGGQATATETAVTTVPEGGGEDGSDGGGGQEGGGQEGGEEELSLPRVGAYNVLSDPALDPDNIVDERRVSWDDLAPESKQLFVRIQGFPPC